MPQPLVYLDNNSTTPVHRNVMEAFIDDVVELYGNPSASHSAGRRARRAIDEERVRCKEIFGCPKMIFVSSASEGNNLVIRSRVCMFKDPHIVMSAIEHPSVYNTVKAMGCPYDVVPVSAEGLLDLRALESAIRPNTILVCIIRSNNETGVIQDTRAIRRICEERSVHLHIDATQCVGKVPYRFNSDTAVVSAHKFGGLKGIAAVLMTSEECVRPICTGGKQEFGLRAGTESAAMIRSFGVALETSLQNTMGEVESMRDLVEKFLEDKGCHTNSRDVPRLPNTLSSTLPKRFDGKTFMQELDREGICVSMGAACAQGGPSGTLRAMKLTEEEERRTLRISLGIQTTPAEIDRLLSVLTKLFGR